MTARLPGCPPWCASKHTGADSAHFANVDLIEHLDDAACLLEINVRVSGSTRTVLLRFTDRYQNTITAGLPQEAAGVLGYFIREFDRRAVRELGHALSESAQMLEEGR
ncbi:hypothetical protein AB0L05_17200 [Nonomuraea pusilla]|uniref:hypothetical protein n=1 Tax=Nonomuraea pusilla TaxID=46177 RepID=UPI00333349EF